MARSTSRAPRRGKRRSLARWLVLAGVVAVAFLYYRPLQSFVHANRALAARRLEVRALRQQNRVLGERLAGSAGDAWLVRSARQLGLVKPGERLYIVKGIAAWERAHGLKRGRR